MACAQRNRVALVVTLLLAACGGAPPAPRDRVTTTPAAATPATATTAEDSATSVAAVEPRGHVTPCREGDASRRVELSDVEPTLRATMLSAAGLVVRTEAGVVERDATCGDLARVTELALEDVPTLRGLERLPALHALAVRDVHDGDLTPLVALPLELLHVGPPDWEIGDRPPTSIVDFTPIGRVTSLLELRVIAAGLRSIDFVAGLGALRALDVRHNALTDLTPLRAAPRLEALRLGFNQVADLTPLGGLTELASLDASSNPVADLTPLAGHPHLTSLTLFDTRVRDASPCLSMPALRSAYFCRAPVLDAPEASPAAVTLEALRRRGVGVPNARHCRAG